MYRATASAKGHHQLFNGFSNFHSSRRCYSRTWRFCWKVKVESGRGAVVSSLSPQVAVEQIGLFGSVMQKKKEQLKVKTKREWNLRKQGHESLKWKHSNVHPRHYVFFFIARLQDRVVFSSVETLKTRLTLWAALPVSTLKQKDDIVSLILHHFLFYHHLLLSVFHGWQTQRPPPGIWYQHVLKTILLLIIGSFCWPRGDHLNVSIFGSLCYQLNMKHPWWKAL